MDDFGNSSGGFSSNDAAGCSTDAGGCSAISNSDTGGMLSSSGGFIDSGPYSVDTFSNIGIASICDEALGISDYVQCDLTENNAYYHASFQNNMEHEHVGAYPNDIHVDSSQSTYHIPAMPSAPYFVDGYLNKVRQSTSNQTEENELMLLRSEIAQLQIMLASSKGDENKNAAIRAKIWDLNARMESKGYRMGQYNLGLSNYPNHVTAVTKLSEAASFYQRPQSAGYDMQKMQKIYKAHQRSGWIGLIIFAVIIILSPSLGLL